VQRCTVHKHRNLLTHAPDALHDEITADYTDMMYADTAKAVQDRRRAFLRKWRLRCPAVATSLEEAGNRLFSFVRLPPSQWRSARTTNAIERLHEDFKLHQDTDRTALGRNRRHVVLGAARVRPDHHAQSRRLADFGREASFERSVWTRSLNAANIASPETPIRQFHTNRDGTVHSCKIAQIVCPNDVRANQKALKRNCPGSPVETVCSDRAQGLRRAVHQGGQDVPALFLRRRDDRA